MIVVDQVTGHTMQVYDNVGNIQALQIVFDGCNVIELNEQRRLLLHIRQVVRFLVSSSVIRGHTVEKGASEQSTVPFDQVRVVERIKLPTFCKN